MDGYILVGLIALLGILFLVYKIFFANGNDAAATVEVQTEDDNPYLKQLSEFRNTLLEHMLATFSVVWGVSRDEIYLHTDNNDWHNHIVVLIYRNQMARLYINWERKTLKVSYSFRTPAYSMTKSKLFFIRHNKINYEKFTAWGEKLFDHTLKHGYPTLDDLSVECIERAKEILNSNADDAAYRKLLVDVWSNYVLHEKGEDRKIDANNFEKLSAYVMKYCNEELQDFIAEQKH